MGIYDRDYWRDRYNKQTRHNESASFRNPEVDDGLSGHAYFKPHHQLSAWWVFLFRFVWYSVVFYSAVRLVKRLLT